MRFDLVENVRGKIADDDYENDLKLSIAIDRLLDALELEDETDPPSRNSEAPATYPKLAR